MAEQSAEFKEHNVSFPLGRRGFVLTAGDIVILKLIYKYRLLRREHISTLTRRPPKRLHRRLFRLVDRGYAAAIRLPQQNRHQVVTC